MITGVRDVYYNVKDMDRALSFYTEVLGLEKVYGHGHYATLKLGGLAVSLHWTEGQDVPRIERDSHGAHAGATVTFESNNIPEDRVRLEKGGAVILGENDAPWGHMLTFEDPDGNVLKLMNPK